MVTEKIITKKQKLTGKEFFCRKRVFKDGEINANMSVKQVVNLSRALAHPWPGIYYYKEENKVLFNRVLSKLEAEKILAELKKYKEKK